MFPFQWLTTLSDQLRSRQSRNTRTRRNQNRHFQASFAQTSVSRNVAESLEDRTMLTSVFSIDDVTVVEGNSGTSNAVFTVTRSGTNPGDLNSIASVDFTTQDGTATTAKVDFIALADTLDFTADPSAIEQTQTITIQVYGDMLTEGNETFQILLSNNSADTTILNDLGIATISNDDVNSIRINDITASENEEFTFEISLDEIAGSDIKFLANTLEGTAENNDYTFLTNKQITIQAGELTTQVKVHVHDDEIRETDEMFSLVLSDLQIDGEPLPTNITATDLTGQGTILNDDGVPGSVFTISGEKIIEGNDDTGYLKFTIIRTGGAAGDLDFAASVNFNTVNGTANSGEDYAGKSETIHFSASDSSTSQTSIIYVTIQGDTFKELSETVIGRLSNPTGGSILKGNVSSLDAVGIITNDDSEFVFQNSFSADPIHANHTYDRVGQSVAIDEDIMVVGGANNSFPRYNLGVAYVYARNLQGTPLDQSDDSWDYQTFLQPTVPQQQTYYATSVAIDGDTIVVGADGDSTGAVYVFTRVGDDWKSESPLVERIYIEGLYSRSRFGTSVAIYENTIVIGAMWDASSGTQSGATYIFENVNANWSAPSLRRLIPTNPDFGDDFGISVAVHSDIIVVGAQYDDDNGNNSGAAYVYTKVGENWITNSPLVTKLTASNGMTGDEFGASVATNGTDVVIGASKTNSNGNRSGSAYLYTVNGSNWNSMPPIEIEFIGEDENDYFGTSVAISDNKLVVGAAAASEIGSFFGAVYVYAKNGSDWNVDTAIESVLTHFEWATPGYGIAVGISNSTILIGTPRANLDGFYSGGAYVFQTLENNSWSLITEINPLEPLTAHNGDDNFGQSIAVNEEYLVIGAPGTDAALAPSGIVYVYAKNDAGTPDFYDDDSWDFETSFVDPAPQINYQFGNRVTFGRSVAIHGETIIITAEIPSFPHNGEVYIYTRNGSDWVTIPPTVTPLLANSERQLQREISVALQNDTIVVGNESGSGNVDQSGVVYVYEKNGNDWSTIAPTETMLSASDGVIDDNFGVSVDLDGDQIIVGANENENRGAAYLYQKGITGWNSATEIKLIGSDIQANDYFGKFVAIEGNTVVMTSQAIGSGYSGAVYIFESTKNWNNSLETKVTLATNNERFNFGNNIDLNGSLLAINGSTSVRRTIERTGVTYFYDGTQGWSDYSKTAITYSTTSEGFGHVAVAINQNGFFVATLNDNSADGSLVYNYNRTSSADVHLRVVNSPTTTQPNGEASSLPINQDRISEWSSYWVEIWVNASNPTDAGVFSTGLDLNYNTELTSATEIEFGAAFSQSQTGTINDASGTIEGLYAETTASDLGIENYLLFARIKFESRAEDQVVLDYAGKSIGPHDLGFNISSQQVSLVGEIPVTTNLGQFYGASIYANPYDLNDDDVINFRDLILFASAYSSIPSESALAYSWFADYNQSDRVDFRDLMLFASNYGKNKASQSTIHYPPNFPDVWNQLLTVESSLPPSINAKAISQSTADTMLNSVVEQVAPQLTASQNETLVHIDIQVVDLEGDILGRAVPGTIYIDVNAAGHGWFVDDTPLDHSEFTFTSELTLIALPDSEAADGVDLWTVILHELGHLLGQEHAAEGIMQETLAPGERYLPAWEEDADSFFIELKDDTNLIDF